MNKAGWGLVDSDRRPFDNTREGMPEKGKVGESAVTLSALRLHERGAS